MKHPLVYEFVGAVFLVALGALALLAISYVPHTNPVSVTLASIRPFIAVGFGVFGILFCLLARWVRGGLMVLIAALCLGQVWFSTTGLRAGPPDGTGQQIKVISFNILWQNERNGARIAEFLKAEAPDLTFIQEAGPLQPFLADLAEVFPYQVGCGKLTNRCDLMLLSRHPLTDPQIGDLSNASSKRLITATATINGATVNVIAPHLTKPYNETHQYWEFQTLAAKANAVEGPVIVAGDFNSAAWAPDFVDLLEESGLRLPPEEPGTWPVFMGDWGIPIDHVLARTPTTIASVRDIEDNMGSNHRGLIADIRIPAAN